MERDWAFSSCHSSEASAGAARDPKPVSIFCLSGEALLPSARTGEPLKKPAAARIEAKEPLNKSAAARMETKILSTFVDRIFASSSGYGKDGFHGKTHLLSQVRFSVTRVRKRWIRIFDRWIQTSERSPYPCPRSLRCADTVQLTYTPPVLSLNNNGGMRKAYPLGCVSLSVGRNPVRGNPYP